MNETKKVPAGHGCPVGTMGMVIRENGYQLVGRPIEHLRGGVIINELRVIKWFIGQ